MLRVLGSRTFLHSLAPLRSLNNATKKVLVERTETLRFSAWKAEAPWDDASLLLIGQQRGSVR